jgi:hypothetical protein
MYPMERARRKSDATKRAYGGLDGATGAIKKPGSRKVAGQEEPAQKNGAEPGDFQPAERLPTTITV